MSQFNRTDLIAVTKRIQEEMFQTENPIHELNHMLVRYDLTPNQAKVYLFLSKIGVKTASEISKALKIPRTETYHLLSTLQQKGIIFSVLAKPTKFNAVGLEESLEILINNEKNRINELELGKSNLIKLWNIIPKNEENDDESQNNKFQSLQGRNVILVKIEQMVKESNESILILGTNADFKRFYFTEFMELLNNTKSELRILTDYSYDKPHIFESILPKVKKIEDKNREDFCFIIKDDSEVIFFISDNKIKEMLAVWTDSKAFVITLRSLFSLMWKKSHHINETDTESSIGLEITYKHRLREIEQEKRILNYLQEHFHTLENTKDKN